MAIARSTPAQKPRGLASRMSISDLSSRATGGSPLAKTVDDQCGGADCDCAVGDVERRKIPAAVMDEQEVDDVTERQAIVQIAERAADDQREAGAKEAGAAAAQQPRHR